MFGEQPNGAGVNSPSSQAGVIHVDDLLKAAQSKWTRPEILQVGFAIQYKGRHVPGAIYAGPGSSEEGLAGLKKAVAGISPRLARSCCIAAAARGIIART